MTDERIAAAVRQALRDFDERGIQAEPRGVVEYTLECLFRDLIEQARTEWEQKRLDDRKDAYTEGLAEGRTVPCPHCHDEDDPTENRPGFEPGLPDESCHLCNGTGRIPRELAGALWMVDRIPNMPDGWKDLAREKWGQP